jgi:hypothetical protein
MAVQAELNGHRRDMIQLNASPTTQPKITSATLGSPNSMPADVV